MRKVLLIGSGKSSSYLLKYLLNLIKHFQILSLFRCKTFICFQLKFNSESNFFILRNYSFKVNIYLPQIDLLIVTQD